jgi:hypothetical protein
MVVFIFTPFLDRENGPFKYYNADGREFDDRGGEKNWLRWWVKCGMEIGEGISRDPLTWEF